ncbi:GH18273 [Drosophila grimshawi]|uniref:GH18273 n=1 Tax=Drosophila grimshawi TaxID=7222 RepID=B4JFF6_DROGR|nr:GH18273 [Drosophila grimshawi]
MKFNRNGRETVLLVPSPNNTFPVRTCSNASSLRLNMDHDHDKIDDDTEEGLGYTHTLLSHHMIARSFDVHMIKLGQQAAVLRQCSLW